MDIIDFHTHLFPDALAPKAIQKLIECAPVMKNHTDGTESGLITSMKNNNIARSVILPVATKPEQVQVINNQQAALNREYLIPFGTLHPDMTDIDETIGFLRANQIRGVKLHPEYQDFYMDNPRYFRFYEALDNAEIAVLFHAGKDPGPFTSDHALPDAFLNVHKNFPTLTIIAAHMGGWKLWDDVFTTLCGLPLFFDTAAIYGLLDKTLFMRMVNKHGVENILFASDSPWFDQGEAVRWIDSMPLHEKEKECILCTNARRIIGD